MTMRINDRLRTATEWNELDKTPDDFNATDIWAICEKMIPDSRGVARWKCVFCRVVFKGANVTKARAHVGRTPPRSSKPSTSTPPSTR